MTDREAIFAAYNAAVRAAVFVLFADPEYAAARAAFNAAQTRDAALAEAEEEANP